MAVRIFGRGLTGRSVVTASLLLVVLMMACVDEIAVSNNRARLATGTATRTGTSATGATVGRANATTTARPTFGPAIDPVLQPRPGSSVQFGEAITNERVTVSVRLSWMGQTPDRYYDPYEKNDHVALLVPENPLDRPRSEEIDPLGNAYFQQVPPGKYHLLYKVNFNVFGEGQRNSLLLSFPRLSLHDHSANLIAYWCRPVIVLSGEKVSPRDSLELFWNNEALPRTPAGVAQAVLGEEGIFRASVEQFTFLPLTSGSTSFTYSILIADPYAPTRTLWASPWQASEGGMVKISWNGYVAEPGSVSGIVRRTVLPDEAGAVRLPAGKYLYAIQFREVIGKGTGSGRGFPEMLGLFSPPVSGVPQDDGIRQGEAFQTVEFGQTLYCPFYLEPAPPSTTSATLSADP